MESDKGTKQGFCESFNWAEKMTVRWFDLTGYCDLTRGRCAKVQLKEGGRSGEYVGFLVTILNKEEGPIDQKFFLFDDYLSGRADLRKDYKEGFKVVDHVGWKWFVAVPTDTGPVRDAVAGYVSMFAS